MCLVRLLFVLVLWLCNVKNNNNLKKVDIIMKCYEINEFE